MQVVSYYCFDNGHEYELLRTYTDVVLGGMSVFRQLDGLRLSREVRCADVAAHFVPVVDVVTVGVSA